MIDDAFLGVDPAVYLQLAAAPDDADIFDEKVWFACNEALGKFLDLNEFRSQAEQAKRVLSFRAKFKNLRLNQRIDATCNSSATRTGWLVLRRLICRRSPVSRAAQVWTYRRPLI